MLSESELRKYELRWKRAFAFAAVVLVFCLVDLTFLSITGPEKSVCYSMGVVAALLALYAAKKLRDPERLDAAKNGSWLNGEVNRPSGLNLDDD